MTPVLRSRALARLPRQLGRSRQAHSHSSEIPPPQSQLPGAHGKANTYVPPPTEGMGQPFWLGLATVVGSAVGWSLYTGAWQPGTDPLSKWLQQKQDVLRKEWAEEGAKHAVLMERAARDRVMFANMPMNKTVTVRYLEQFNAGAPQNREAGWRSDLTPIKEFMKKQQEKQEARFA